MPPIMADGFTNVQLYLGAKSRASVVGNIEYTQLVYAAILGFLLFSEVPDIYTIIGAAIIVGSSIYIFHRQALLKAEKKSA